MIILCPVHSKHEFFVHQASRTARDRQPAEPVVCMEQRSEGRRASATSTIAVRLSNTRAPCSRLDIMLICFETDCTIIYTIWVSDKYFL